MDIILKEVEINTGYITFICPVCGADVHVDEDDTMDIYWMIRQAYHMDTDRRFRDGSCKVCGRKEGLRWQTPY
jgi:hypothetical protein